MNEEAFPAYARKGLFFKGGTTLAVNGVMFQGFEWYLKQEDELWVKIQQQAKHYADIGLTAVWLPPAYKGAGGIYDVGYGAYDLYDLGEFDQKGSIRTKYGTREDYLKAIRDLQAAGLQVYGDIVLNHKMGADENEVVRAYEMNMRHMTERVSDALEAEVATRFTFPGRQGKYSPFCWDWTCFDGIDYDVKSKRHGKFLFESKQWDTHVDDENGNYDYLMGADLDFSNPQVVDELNQWGRWYLETTGLDGFRLDALKHIDASFFNQWLSMLRSTFHRELFTVGEYWHGNVTYLLRYLEQVHYQFSLFDVPLHYRFYDASRQKGNYDLRRIFDGTLVQAAPMHSVTFVDNHDTQPSQGLQSFVEDWFKPHAYALILLREAGYPCVFYGDYEGIPSHGIADKKDLLEKLLKARRQVATGWQKDYFDDMHVIGWTREGGLACLISNAGYSEKYMYVGHRYHRCVFTDIFSGRNCVIDENGCGRFVVDDAKISVYMMQF